MDKFNKKLTTHFINLISYPIWIAASIWRNRTLRTVFVIALIVASLLVYYGGVELLGQTVFGALRILMGAMFMIIQFGAMFWFISRTKTVEVQPGDSGQLTFDDYYGNEHLVATVKQWLTLMTDQQQLKDIGGKSISGLLLIGKPGTGKTYLARALAGEAKAAFLGIDGTSLTSMFLGIGALKVMNFASKVRKWAKIHGACIWFIDEIDSIGGNRGGVQGDNRRPMAGGMAGMFGGGLGVLSRLLVEMEGFHDTPLRDQIQNTIRSWFGMEPIDPGVVLIMAATNRPDALDPALTRAGRFDKKITVDSPDKRSRHLIFEGYLKKVRNEIDEDEIRELVANTSWATPADIATAVEKDAPRIAIFKNRDHIKFEDIEDAMYEQLVGIANPISDFDPTQKRQVAVHEAGHVLMMHLARPEKRIARASIIRRGGGILGFALDVDTKDIYAFPLSKLKADIMVSLAGHIAVEVVMKEPWTGAGSDLQAVQNRMYALAVHGEFAKQFPFEIDDPFKSKAIKESADDFLTKATAEVRRALTANRDKLDALTDLLYEREELTSSEIYEVLGEAPTEDRYEI